MNTCSRNKSRTLAIRNAAAVERSDDSIMEDKTMTLQDSKRYRSGGLPKSNAFTAPKTAKFHRSYESSSSASSKNSSEKKVKPKGMKLINSPSSVLHFPYRDSVKDLRISVFDNINDDIQPEPKRSSFLRKSLAWDSAFFISAGLLDPEELFVLNKGFKKTHLNQKDDKKSEVATKTSGSQSNAILQNSKRTRSGGFPKSTAFTTPTTEKNHRSYESSSSASSKNLSERKFNLKGVKLTNSPSSVLHFPLPSSPATSDDGWLSESLSSTTITHQSPIPVLDFHSQNSEEKMFISQNATIKSSGLRMPSPRIGFFDMEPGSM